MKKKILEYPKWYVEINESPASLEVVRYLNSLANSSEPEFIILDDSSKHKVVKVSEEDLRIISTNVVHSPSLNFFIKEEKKMPTSMVLADALAIVTGKSSPSHKDVPKYFEAMAQLLFAQKIGDKVRSLIDRAKTKKVKKVKAFRINGDYNKKVFLSASDLKGLDRSVYNYLKVNYNLSIFKLKTGFYVYAKV